MEKCAPVRFGKIITSGKTKEIWEDLDHPDCIIALNTDAVTAKDGEVQDKMIGKGVFSTNTTSNVFQLLANAIPEIPVAFREKVSDNAFRAERLDMWPLEVVARGEVVCQSSILGRMPALEGLSFTPPHVEFFFKDNARHDPVVYFDWERQVAVLYAPKVMGPPIGEISLADLGGFSREDYDMIVSQTRRTFVLLRSAWRWVGVELGIGRLHLIDFKIEWGRNQHGDSKIGDVVDNDSWRLTCNGRSLDKDPFRARGAVDAEMTEDFERVAELSELLLRYR